MRRHKSIPTFGDYSTRLISELKNDLRWGTSRTYTKTRSSFLRFLAGDISIDSIDSRLIFRYNTWLRGRGVIRNTISFYNRVLRAMYNKAVLEYRFPDLRPFSGVYTGVDRTQSKAVPADELSKLTSANIEGNTSLSLAKDIFLFSYCMRGMPFVDMAYLKKNQISGGYLTYSRRKTGATLRIKVEPEAKLIMDKYAQLMNGSPYVFPLLLNNKGQTASDAASFQHRSAMDYEVSAENYRRYLSALASFNRKLKYLSSILEIKEKLSSYSARHSWATSANGCGCPTSTISAALGHSCEKITRIYIAPPADDTLESINRKIVEMLNIKSPKKKSSAKKTSQILGSTNNSLCPRDQ